MTQLPVERRDEIETPIPVFQQLLDRPTGECRYDLRATEWFDDDAVEQTGQIWEDFLCDYETVVKELSLAIRPPDFKGSYEDKGYPEELEWVPYLAYWLFADRAVFVLCDQQDEETPIVLSMGVKPRAEFTPRETNELQY